MKKKLYLVFLSLLILCFLISCNFEKDIFVGNDPKVALILANRGDKAFNDMAIMGVEGASTDLNISTSIIEHDNKKENLQPSFKEAIDKNNQLIIADAYLTPIFEDHVDDYPNRHFIIFDDQVDWDKGKFENISCIVYDSNEASYLAGYLAASLSETDKIGFVAGIDRSINNNFLIGYYEGAMKKNPDVEIYVRYTNTYDEPSVGEEISEKLIGQGVDIIFGAAGKTNQGIIEAADKNDIYVIGVDTDQALLYEGEGEEDLADNIVSSVTKNISQTLYNSIDDYIKNDLEAGTLRVGLAEGGVGLARNKHYEALVPADVRSEIDQLENDIISGKIKVSSTLDMSEDEIENFKEIFKP